MTTTTSASTLGFSKERFAELEKEAKTFIKNLQKKKALIEEHHNIILPILTKFGVKSEWDVPSEYWTSFEWKTSRLKDLSNKISEKIHRLNRVTEKLKYSFWAIYPKGTKEYFDIYP
jgi:DNA repair exonuclease SbcCD ATPase subunit